MWYMLLFALVLSLWGCGKSEVQPLRPPSESAQKLYLKSQKELVQGNYKQAYADYEEAVAEDSGIANISHLSSILYSWAIAQSKAEDVPLLKAQKQVWLEPEQLLLRRELMSLAINKEKGVIHVFGLGSYQGKVANPEQKKRLEQQAALADAKVWVARLTRWSRDGVECPFDVSETVMEVKMLESFSIQGAFLVVKVSAPLKDSME
jgi:hypothetical protein